jgi:hypothetical protein
MRLAGETSRSREHFSGEEGRLTSSPDQGKAADASGRSCSLG